MKKTHKKVLGFFGLVAVAAMTAFAAFIPVPKTQAVSSIVDTIEVRVVGLSPNVYITGPADETVFTGADQTITYNYENIRNLTLTIEPADGGGSPTVIPTEAPSGDYGSGAASIDFSTFGYGNYIIRVVGEGSDGMPRESAIEVAYLPVTAAVEEDEETGDADLTLNYSDSSTDIDKLRIDVYDKDGNLVSVLSPIMVTPPNKKVAIPFSETNLPGGKYTLVVTALDAGGNALADSYELPFNYQPVEVPDTGGGSGAPNTGGLMTALNVSKSDYLITGLLIFFIVGMFGTAFVVRGRKDNKKRR